MISSCISQNSFELSDASPTRGCLQTADELVGVNCGIPGLKIETWGTQSCSSARWNQLDVIQRGGIIAVGGPNYAQDVAELEFDAAHRETRGVVAMRAA